jgi:hypothetical protein
MPLLADLKTFKTNSTCTDVYVIGADATGDIPHVAAAMKKYDKHAAVIFEWGTSKAGAMRASLEGLGVKATRLHVVTAAQLMAAATEADASAVVTKVRGKNKGPRNEARDIVFELCGKAKWHRLQLHDSTMYAAEALGNATLRKALHADFRGSRDAESGDDQLDAYLTNKQVPLDRHVVVLWGRTSGKDKTVGLQYGPHPYGDSSVTGLVQLATCCVAKGWTVLVAGDVADTKKSRFPATVIFLGKFWNDPHWKGVRPTQKMQLRLFYLLKRSLDTGKHLVHVGMRSGNLDYYAFAGQSIVYLVPAGFDDVRIATLVDKVKARWHKSTAPLPPKRQYNPQWGDEWLRLLKTTRLGTLLPPDHALNAQATALGDLYPTGTATELNAHLLYRAVKAAAREADPKAALAQKLEEGEKAAELLQAFYAERSKRGFGTPYLLELMATIEGCLSRQAT